MKLKNIILNALASVGMVLLILPMCLDLFTLTVKVGERASDPVGFKIFTDWTDYVNTYKLLNKEFASVWATLVGVLAIVLLVLSVAYVVFFVLQALKVGKLNYRAINQILSICILVLTVVALVFGIIFMAANSFSIGSTKTSNEFGFGVGLIMLLVGGLLTGVFGLIANKKAKSKK